MNGGMKQIPKEERVRYLEAAREIAAIAGEIGRRYFGSRVEVERKADNSPVTIADREAEVAMRRYIEEAFSEHQIIGEEAGQSGAPDSPWKWVLDPIDGTISFIHGIPLYTSLIALLYEDEPLLGVIYNPQTEEMVSAGRGLGCHYNGEPCSVSRVSELERARLFLSDPSYFLHSHPTYAPDLLRSVRFSRSWGDGHGYIMLATGRAEIMIDPKMNLWDIACLMPIVTEAGGEFTDTLGSRKLGDSAVATNGLLHASVMHKLGIDDWG